MVECLTNNPKIEDSKPGTGTARKKKCANFLMQG